MTVPLAVALGSFLDATVTDPDRVSSGVEPTGVQSRGTNHLCPRGTVSAFVRTSAAKPLQLGRRDAAPAGWSATYRVAIRRSKRGLPRSCAKSGSTVSQRRVTTYGSVSRRSSWSSAFSGSPASR